MAFYSEEKMTTYLEQKKFLTYLRLGLELPRIILVLFGLEVIVQTIDTCTIYFLDYVQNILIGMVKNI